MNGDLHRRTDYPLPAHLILEYEELDRLVGHQLMIETEEQFRKLKAGSVPWSPAYLKARRQVEYWVCRLKIVSGQCPENARYMMNLPNKFGIMYEIMDEATIILYVKAAFAKRKCCKQMAE